MLIEILYKRQTYTCLWCFLFLALILKQVNAYNNISWNSSCHCIPLTLCPNLNKQIAWRTKVFTEISYLIKKSLCRFNGIEISVCCHNFDRLHYISGSFKNHEESYDDILDGNTPFNCPLPFGEEFHYDANGQKFHSNHSQLWFKDNEHVGNGKKYFAEKAISTTTLVEINKAGIKKCGILESDFTDDTLYPWIVRLAYRNNTEMTVNYRCMGSLIDTKYILTAAHCVANLVQDIKLIYVRLGPDDNYVDYEIAETIVHHNYNKPLFNNDVALLKLSPSTSDISNDQFVTICLPEINLQRSIGISEGLVGSWNSVSRSKNVSTISYIHLTIMNNTECAIRYAHYSEYFERSIIITPTEFCAQAIALTDVCEGDSGGPFMSLNESNRYTIIGIVAFGPNTNCGQSNLPGVYTNVSSHIDWIKKFTALNSTNIFKLN